MVREQTITTFTDEEWNKLNKECDKIIKAGFYVGKKLREFRKGVDK